MQVEIHNYEDLGQILREARESLGLELREVAQRLHIRAKYLAALEDGQLDVIPGKVYARGYLRQYAEFLGLEGERTVAAFDRVATAGRVKYFVPEPTSRAYQPGVVIVLIALAALVMLYLYWYRTYKAVEYPPVHSMVSPVPERLLEPVLPSDVLEDEEAFAEPSAISSDEEEVSAEDAAETAATSAPQLPAVDENEVLPWLQQNAQ